MKSGATILESSLPVPQIVKHEFTICCHYSVAKMCSTLRDPMDCSTPGLPISHHLLEFAQVRAHWISDTTQLFHPLLPSSAFNLSPHQGLFQWVDFTSGGLSIGASASASILPMNIQDFRIYWFDLLAVQESLRSLLQHHSSKALILPSLWPNSHICMYLLGLSYDPVISPFLVYTPKTINNTSA